MSGQRQATTDRKRQPPKRWVLRQGNSASPQPLQPARTPLALLYRVRVRNTPGEQRNTWASFAKAARENGRMGQSELARRLDVERTTVWRWETGKQKPESADAVAAFARVLDVDLDEALAAAGLRPGATPPTEPTREPDEEIDLVANDPDLDNAMKTDIIRLIYERRDRDRVSGIEDTRRIIDLAKRRRGA